MIALAESKDVLGDDVIITLPETEVPADVVSDDWLLSEVSAVRVSGKQFLTECQATQTTPKRSKHVKIQTDCSSTGKNPVPPDYQHIIEGLPEMSENDAKFLSLALMRHSPSSTSWKNNLDYMNDQSIPAELRMIFAQRVILGVLPSLRLALPFLSQFYPPSPTGYLPEESVAAIRLANQLSTDAVKAGKRKLSA
jgi:hypothetical protein